MAKDFVHHAEERLCGIDYDAAAGYVFFRSMHSRNEFLLLRFSAEVSWIPRHTLIKPPIYCFNVVNIKNKNAGSFFFARVRHAENYYGIH